MKEQETIQDDRPLGTQEVARICMVAPRTVVKWVDSGKLKGYRIPESTHRRVMASDLVMFLRQCPGFPIPDELLGIKRVAESDAAAQLRVLS